ncbi:MAG: hypothetical protein ACKOC5_03610 [Chloroflexota bacterium]
MAGRQSLESQAFIGANLRQALSAVNLSRIIGLGRIRKKPDEIPERVYAGRFGGLVIRPDDLLILYIHFENWCPSDKFIIQDNAGEASYVTIGFPAQSIGEDTVPEPVDGDALEDPGDIRSALSGPSWLVFKAPPNTDIVIPYTLAGMLDWSKFELFVLPDAELDTNLFDQPELLTSALKRYTTLEAPFRLALSPAQKGDRRYNWVHNLLPVVMEHIDPVSKHSLVTAELWKTHLGQSIDGQIQIGARQFKGPTIVHKNYHAAGWQPPEPAILKVLYAYPGMSGPGALQLPLANIHYTAIRENSRRIKDCIQVEKLSLSALGASLELRADWSAAGETEPLSVSHWSHSLDLGRDSYVEVVEPGKLWPTGHKASKVTISERKIYQGSATNNHPVAYLSKRTFLIITESERTYRTPQSAFNEPFGELEKVKNLPLPFQTIRILDRVTPKLVGSEEVVTSEPEGAFWPYTDEDQPHRFQMQAEDLDGNWSSLSSELMFIKDSIEPAEFTPLPDAGLGFHFAYSPFVQFNDTSNAARRQVLLHGARSADQAGRGQRVAFVGRQGKGAVDLINFHWCVRLVGKDVYPLLEDATAIVPALNQLVGNQQPVQLKYFPPYLAGSANPTHCYAQLTGGPISAAFSGSQAGGIATPKLQIKGLSYTLGVVSYAGDNLEDLAQAQQTRSARQAQRVRSGEAPGALVQKFFAADTRLLGLNLFDLLSPDLNDLVTRLPEVTTEHSGDQTITKMAWSTDRFLGSDDTEFSVLGFSPRRGSTPASLSILFEQTINRGSDAGSAGQRISGRLENFSLTFGEVLRAGFRALEFRSGTGQKSQLTPIIDPDDFEFTGPLAFLDVLRKAIPLDQFVDPPYIEVDESQAIVGYSLPLPDVPMGMFALQNLLLDSKIILPFETGSVQMWFEFGKRSRPFTVTVSLIAGGGFFSIAVSPERVIGVEAMLEFGGNLALDLVVASGSVQIMAGIHFLWIEPADGTAGKTEVGGYLRIAGSLSVLGLIHISITLTMELHYRFEDQVVWSQATLVVEVEVLFFSTDAEISIYREFRSGGQKPAALHHAVRAQGEPPDEPLVECVLPPDWAAYCEAFADYPPGVLKGSH